MAIKTIGQVLKEKRTALGLSLTEAEQLTHIQKLYIVALETDDYKALPGEFYIKAYLKQYAEKLELDAGKIIQAYDRGEGIQVEDKEDILETYRFVKPSERVEEEEEEGSKTWRDYIPIITLSSVAVLIVVVVVIAVAVNRPNTPALVSDDYTYATSTTKKSSEPKETESSPAETAATTAPTTPAQSISISGSGSAITATIANATEPVNIQVTSTAANNVWVGITNSALASGAQTLTPEANTLSTTLTSGATTSLITLGSVAGVSMTINGQNVDLSALTTQGVGRVTLQVQPAAQQTPTQDTTQSTPAPTTPQNTTESAATTTVASGQ